MLEKRYNFISSLINLLVQAGYLSVTLKKDAALTELWNGLTDIQRNEWCCYAETGKKKETRAEHIRRMISDMKAGKKTPCCWPGCPHRRERGQIGTVFVG
jgi:hypothetical protein